MTSETPRSNVRPVHAASCSSIAIGLILLFSALIFDYRGPGLYIAGFCFLLAPFALVALGRLLTLTFIGIANPQVGISLLVAAGCTVCIYVYNAPMLFHLYFTLCWACLVTFILSHGCKYWYYRKMAIVVEARLHSKEKVWYNTGRGPHSRYEWIGDYEVPVSRNKTRQTSPRVHEDRRENEHDTVSEILRVRKKFIVGPEKFNETVREVNVLPRYPKHAILDYDEATATEKVAWSIFLSVLVGVFAIPGLGMPILSFNESGGFWVPRTDWQVIDSYLIIVGIACLATLRYTFDDSLSREALVLRGGEQELLNFKELDLELQQKGDDERTVEMTLEKDEELVDSVEMHDAVPLSAV